MSLRAKSLLAIGAAAVAMTAGVTDASARKVRHAKKSASPSPVCVGTVEGQASSTGILGLGTARAQDAAIEDWIIRTNAAYGERYSNYSKAQVVRWDCKKNALVLAKCVVTAKPCRK